MPGSMSRPSRSGRDKPGGDAICYVALDEAVSDELLDKIHQIPMVKRARRLKF